MSALAPADPAVAVVVPARDAGRYLAAALGSLQRQTRSDWTCVVVDDGSTDDTAEVATSFLDDPRIRLVRQANAGVAAARNAGLGLVRGSGAHLVAFLDADDVLLPDALERLGAALEDNPDAVGAYGTAEYVDGDGRPVAPGLHPQRQRDRREVRGLDLGQVPPDRPLTTFRMLVVVGPVWPSAVVLLRLAVVTAVGGFAEDLPQCEDWDLYLRSSRHGPLVFVDEQVAWYRRHDANLTNGTADNAHLVHVVRCRAWADPANSRGQRLLAARAWRALQHRRAVRAVQRCVRAARARDGADLRRALRVARLETLALLRVTRPVGGPTGSPEGTPSTPEVSAGTAAGAS